MSLVTSIRSRLSFKISLTLAVLMVVLTTGAAGVITINSTRQMEEMTLEKARLAASLGARQYGDTFDNAIDGGLLTVNDVFDRNYVEIKGWDWGDKPKFHTRFDALTDRAVLIFQDRFLETEDFVFAVGVDTNGYLPTHNSRFQLPLTGDPKKDLAGNRTKRVFNDPVGLAAARNTTEPGLQQVYQRDTGEVMWDVSSPILVKGKPWGAFRIGVSMERIGAKQRSLMIALTAIFGAFAFFTILTMYVVVERAMRPVAELTAAANAISMGEELDTPIKARSIDEIGQLTKMIERLRVSMKAAMSRLGG
jgi:HAMP domain-containing protein